MFTKLSKSRKFVVVLISFVACFIFGPHILKSGSLTKPTLLTTQSLNSNSSELKFGNISQDDPLLVSYVKENILVPPAPISKAYNFSKPHMNASIENPSQYGQNILILDILKKLGKERNGFFIECGAFDGYWLSNTLYFESKYDWNGLLVEVHPDFYNTLKNFNRKSWIANACLSMKPHPELIDLHLDPKSGIHSLIHDSRHHTNEKIKTQCIPLYTFLLALGIDQIDYFSLDVEGAEYPILQTIPFDKLKFSVIEVEVDYILENKPKVKSLLESKGYILYRYVYPDYIFIHESVKDIVGNISFTPKEWKTWEPSQ